MDRRNFFKGIAVTATGVAYLKSNDLFGSSAGKKELLKIDEESENLIKYKLSKIDFPMSEWNNIIALCGLLDTLSKSSDLRNSFHENFERFLIEHNYSKEFILKTSNEIKLLLLLTDEEIQEAIKKADIDKYFNLLLKKGGMQYFNNTSELKNSINIGIEKTAEKLAFQKDMEELDLVNLISLEKNDKTVSATSFRGATTVSVAVAVVVAAVYNTVATAVNVVAGLNVAAAISIAVSMAISISGGRCENQIPEAFKDIQMAFLVASKLEGEEMKCKIQDEIIELKNIITKYIDKSIESAVLNGFLILNEDEQKIYSSAVKSIVLRNLIQLA